MFRFIISALCASLFLVIDFLSSGKIFCDDIRVLGINHILWIHHIRHRQSDQTLHLRWVHLGLCGTVFGYCQPLSSTACSFQSCRKLKRLDSYWQSCLIPACCCGAKSVVVISTLRFVINFASSIFMVVHSINCIGLFFFFNPNNSNAESHQVCCCCCACCFWFSDVIMKVVSTILDIVC